VRFCVALALLAGCDSLWGITRLLPSTDGGTPIDAVVGCQPQIIHDDFTGTQLCDHWGTPSGLEATEGGGMLAIAPLPNTGGSQGGCFAAAPVAFGDDGVFIKVVSVVTQSGDANGGSYMFFKIDTPAPAGAATIQLSIGSNKLSAVGPGNTIAGSAAYDPAQMKWWRLRPDHGLGGVTADASPDGVTWQTIGSVPGTIPTSVIVEFTAGTYGVGLPIPGKTIIEDFNVCPSASRSDPREP